MRLETTIIGCAIAVLGGCYDLSFETNTHIVTDFSVMALHVDPPEIRPGSPIAAEILFADPQGEGRRVWCAWQIDVADFESNERVETVSMVAPADAGGRSISIPALWANFVESPKKHDYYAYIRVHLCAGEIDDAEALLKSGVRLDGSLCKNGPMLIATKSLEQSDPTYPQNNPVIDRITFDGELLLPEAEGGEAIVRCGTTPDCSGAHELALHLGEGSIERTGMGSEASVIGVDLHSEGTPSMDGGVDGSTDVGTDGAVVVFEVVRAEWFVTGGTLSQERTFYLNDFSGLGNTVAWQSAGPGAYTLWVVLRDSRGGNAFNSYRIRVEEGRGE